jgi:hypothetical protein
LPIAASMMGLGGDISLWHIATLRCGISVAIGA